MRVFPGREILPPHASQIENNTVTSLSWHTQHRLDHDSLLGIFSCLVCLLKRIECDQAIKGEAALLIEFDQTRNKDVRHAIALDNALDLATEEQKRAHIKSHLGSQRGRTDKATGPLHRQRVHRLTKNFRN